MMLSLLPDLPRGEPLSVLAIGAHSDDIEIGCGGTLLAWLQGLRPVHVVWVVLSACGERAMEATRSAEALLERAARHDLVLGEFRDGYMPSQYADVKAFFESLKTRVRPHLVLTHKLQDRHQDHRIAAELTWNTWRDHLILEYEISKYEGDLGSPNLYVPLPEHITRHKATHLTRYFATQRGKQWFDEENFLALARLRGLECRAQSGFAEAFHSRKFLMPQLDAQTSEIV